MSIFDVVGKLTGTGDQIKQLKKTRRSLMPLYDEISLESKQFAADMKEQTILDENKINQTRARMLNMRAGRGGFLK